MRLGQEIRRGFVPSDERDFAADKWPVLRRAQSDLQVMLDRGYPIKSVSRLVGDHYQLTERQRLAVVRAATPTSDLTAREKKRVTGGVNGGQVWIDGLNVIITLETALSGTTLYRCMDGTVRDLAAMCGSYRLIAHTRSAVELLGDYLETIRAGEAVILLDAPVSNTGRLKALIAECFEDRAFSCDIQLLPDVDRQLWGKENVLSSDAIILNQCKSWLNGAAEIIASRLPDVRVLDWNQDVRQATGDEAETNRVFVAVKGIVLGKDGKALILQRRDKMEQESVEWWEFPGGTLEFGETPEQTLVRELREEAGLDVSADRLLFATGVQPDPHYEIVVMTYLCRYADCGRVRISEEHLAFRWADRHELQELLAEDIRECIDKNGLWDIWENGGQ